MIQGLSSIITIFGASIKEGIKLFNNNIENTILYSKALLYLLLNTDISNKSIKKEFLKEFIYSAIESDSEITIITPLCLRYFYDESGERQIIPNSIFFLYTNKNSDTVSKEFKDDGLINKMQTFSNNLSTMGISINLQFMVMDHELLRFDEMNTPNNYIKVKKYLEDLSSKYGNVFFSSVEAFGDPSTSKDYNLIIEQIRSGGIQNTKISTKTFERTIDNRYSNFSKDLTVSPKYRSRGTTRKSRECAVGEAYYHSNLLANKYRKRDINGYLLYVPREVSFDRMIYEIPNETVTFDLKSTEIASK